MGNHDIVPSSLREFEQFESYRRSKRGLEDHFVGILFYIYHAETLLRTAGTVTLKAIAVLNGFTNSPVATVVYTIQPMLARPTFSVPWGTYTSTQTVSISENARNPTIYYTTDGSTPTTSSTVYSGPITVSSTETINAIATAPGFANSIMATANYTISTSALPAPVFSQPSGTYTNSTISLTDSALGGTIYYTTDGSIPTLSSTKYTAPIALNSPGTFTFNAVAAESGYTTSPTTTVVYTIQPTLAKPTFSLASGTYASPQTVSISDVSKNATIYYTTDGSTPTTSSPVYTGPVSVSSSETINAMAAQSGFTNSVVVSASYTIQQSDVKGK